MLLRRFSDSNVHSRLSTVRLGNGAATRTREARTLCRGWQGRGFRSDVCPNPIWLLDPQTKMSLLARPLRADGKGIHGTRRFTMSPSCLMADEVSGESYCSKNSPSKDHKIVILATIPKMTKRRSILGGPLSIKGAAQTLQRYRQSVSSYVSNHSGSEFGLTYFISSVVN